jgi:hypothetical protein
MIDAQKFMGSVPPIHQLNPTLPDNSMLLEPSMPVCQTPAREDCPQRAHFQRPEYTPVSMAITAIAREFRSIPNGIAGL